MLKAKRTCKCGKPRAASQHACLECNAKRLREWRANNPERVSQQRRSYQLSDDERRKDIARSKVSVYVRRGKIQKTPCPCCGSAEVKARILDYNDPLNSLEWLCAAAHAYAVRTGSLPALTRAA